MSADLYSLRRNIIHMLTTIELYTHTNNVKLDLRMDRQKEGRTWTDERIDRLRILGVQQLKYVIMGPSKQKAPL